MRYDIAGLIMSFVDRSLCRICVWFMHTCVFVICICIVEHKAFSTGEIYNESLPTKYDPLRGYFLTSFKNPQSLANCSIFWSSNEFFLLDGCPKSSLEGLQFYIREHKIKRIVDINYGALLEFPEIFTYELTDGVHFSVLKADYYDNVLEQKNISIPTASLVKNYYFSIPKFDVLNSLDFTDRGGSASVYIMNARTFLIPHLEFIPIEGDDVFFWVGNARNGPDANGTQIPNENNSYEPLRIYKDEMIVLTLPTKDPQNKSSDFMTVYDINYIGLWSPSSQRDYGYVRVRYPDDMTPYFAPPTFYFNQYLIEGISLCPPENTVSPVLKYNLSESNRKCSGDCCNLPDSSSESNPWFSLDILLLLSILFLHIIKNCL